MLALCGFGYYMNGFRGFPWLALNFHMVFNLNMDPSVLQIVQNCGNLPIVAKPLYGILSDALYIGGAHRIPYVTIGVLLQAISWGSLALFPIASEVIPALLAFVLLSNIGASISEVAKDALVAEYGHAKKIPGLQSYAYMASAIGGMLGNLIGGFFLVKTQQTKSMFLAFAALLAFQLTISLKTSEKSLNLPQRSNDDPVKKSIPQSIKKQYSDLIVTIKEESIWRPLIWVVSSILLVPILSGSLFCYQTQRLNLDPSVIGMSKVTGQLVLLSLTLLYDRFGKNIPLRKVAGVLQVLYASTLLFDLILVKQINLQLGIPNEVYALCISGLAETISQFKLLPFYVLFASLAPSGCEGSLMSLLASALCLSSTVSGFTGVGLASFLGITSGNFTLLPLGIGIQIFLALLPLLWIDYLPESQSMPEKYKQRKGVGSPEMMVDKSESSPKNDLFLLILCMSFKSTRSVLGKCVYLVTLAMSLFDLQDVCIAIGSIATLDLPMVVDLIGIYGLKGPYCTLTTTNWFLQALSVIPRGSWGDFARRSYHYPMGKSGIVISEPQWLWAHD
ncbi:putative folate-biopterin transporter 8, chloroplastic-like [Dorcoceras hygrometricum]|uniref:Putative folate-biopterin transporter 8, chloroplastic-like n=1 Tax=Dorcoceras hygrometricum TaxID=472368 RepID=A0A2Z7DCC1_9LAMI|nr:putative folate-biopterin transporter 8, chloroplastic-like [Dorcoceras hygrometricum]